MKYFYSHFHILTTDGGQKMALMHIVLYTNELCHMTNMSTMPIYGKNLKKSSSAEAVGQ